MFTNRKSRKTECILSLDTKTFNYKHDKQGVNQGRLVWDKISEKHLRY